MSFSKFCPPKAFCERSKGIYQNVNNPGVLGMLAGFEDNLSTYAAVCICLGMGVVLVVAVAALLVHSSCSFIPFWEGAVAFSFLCVERE